MIALYVIAGILLLIFLLLMLRVRICVTYEKSPDSDGNGSIHAGVGPVKVRLYPKKRKKIKLSDYSPKKYRRMLDADAQKADESSKEEKKKKEKLLPEGISETLDFISELVDRFTRHLRCEILRIRLNIGTSDAAITAIAYSGASAVVELLLELISKNTDMRLLSPKDVYVRADFENCAVHGDISVKFSIRILNILRIGGGILKKYLKKMIRMESSAANKNKNNSASLRKNGDKS